ncbi:DNA replication licensing factor mcm3 [Rhizophagus irregularis DAOM 181602=DAOM 197198]|nr:DNA replication licensing factor mcm3 [Rhizophagus irregularis DAOM 181602=DAOM 197198]
MELQLLQELNINDNDEINSDNDMPLNIPNNDNDKDKISFQLSISTHKDKDKSKMIKFLTDDSLSKEIEDLINTNKIYKQSFAELNLNTLLLKIITSDIIKLFQKNLNHNHYNKNTKI